MAKKCFISGKISGLSITEVYPLFMQAEKELINMGFEPVNPIRFVPVGLPYAQQMELCYSKLDECHSIYLLKNFRDSGGSLSELERSNRLGIEIIKQN